MILILSPAKILNFKEQATIDKFSTPEFMTKAESLVKLMRDLSPSDLSKLLDINTNLTQLNFDRFFNWHKPFTPKNAKQAALTFDGEVFRGLNAKTFSTEDFEYAQTHLRILSGLYGILRPLDLIQAYRLEVSSKLQNPLGKDLYVFWKESVTESVLKALKKSGKPQFILNLASSEYFKTLDLKNKKVRTLNVEFYEYKNDKTPQIVIYTKTTSGMMAKNVI